MRILTVSNCPALEHLGSGYIIANFVSGMRALGHAVDLLQPDDYEICRWMRPRANSYRQALGMYRATKRACRRFSYDVVEFWGGEAWLATRWLARQGLKRPLVVQHTNGPEPRYGRLLCDAGLLKLTARQSWYVGKLVPQAFGCADAVVTVSEYDTIWLTQQGLPPSGKVLSVENPLPQCFLGRPQKHRGSRVIGFCGTWLPKKGIHAIVPAITRILRDDPQWRFLVLGTNPDAGVRDCFPPDLHSRVEVMPMVKDKELLAQQYERMNIFVLPSVIESFGVALAEAMACGCAPVATRVGFAASLEHGKNALLMDQSDPQVLYESLNRLILEPDLRRDIAVGAWQRVQSLRWSDAAQALSQRYEQWLAEHRKAARETFPHL